jgi:hypothetical protein
VAASAAGCGLFAVQQRRGQQRRTTAAGREPLVTPGLLRGPAFAVGLGGIALFCGGLTGTRLVLTRFLQTGRHFTAGDAGPGNLSLAVGTAIGDAVGGVGLTDRIGRKVLRTGPLVQLVGAALLRFELDGLGTGTFSIRDLAPGVVVAGVGAGVVVAARFSFILAAVDDDGTVPPPGCCPASGPSAAPSVSRSSARCSSPRPGPVASPPASTTLSASRRACRPRSSPSSSCCPRRAAPGRAARQHHRCPLRPALGENHKAAGQRIAAVRPGNARPGNASPLFRKRAGCPRRSGAGEGTVDG